MTGLIVLLIFLGAQAGIGYVANLFFRGSPKDFYLASNTIGPFVLFMTIFGTTMTAFALVGSTGEAFEHGIGVYGQLASWSGLVHSAVFFLVGIKVWGLGRRYGFVTQVQYFRARFESNGIGTLLFPILVLLVVPYVVMGMLGAGPLVMSMTRGAFPEMFPTTGGGIPPWLGAGGVTLVVLGYVFFGGQRGTAWANVFQVLVFMIMAVVAFFLAAGALGGVEQATQRVVEMKPDRLNREKHISEFEFLSYCLIPLSVGMFPHLFQQWLTAKSAKAFRLSVILHPLSIMLLWAPCVLIGIWASTLVLPEYDKDKPVVQVDGPVKPFIKPLPPPKPDATAEEKAKARVNPNSVLAQMIARLVANPWLAALISAGIMAAVMSYDSQFLSLGTMFSNDVVLHYFGQDRFTEKQQVRMTRMFIAAIALLSYLVTLVLMLYENKTIFNLGVWCFSGFASLFPIVFAAIYWKRATRAGVFASILATVAVWFGFFYTSNWGAAKSAVDLHFSLFGEPVIVLPVVFIFGASALALVVVSLFTKPPSQATIDKFFDPRLLAEGTAQ